MSEPKEPDKKLLASLLGKVGKQKLPEEKKKETGPLREIVEAMKQWEHSAVGLETEGYGLLETVEDWDPLKRGASGDQVKALQRALKKAGFYHGSISGSFDLPTEKSVYQLQEHAGIDANGEVGLATLQALDRALGLPARRRQAGRTAGGEEMPETGNAFLDGLRKGALAAMKETGIPASCLLAQAVLESSWGEADLARDYNNLFKLEGTGPAGTVHIGGKSWRRYKDGGEAVLDQARRLASDEKYKNLMTLRDRPDRFAMGLGEFSTNRNYGDTLIRIMKQYDLYQFDAAGRG
jgi:hypothetical protein